VYDCSNFVKEHPGGGQIINSFGGAECSWQVWRFHGKKEMEEFGKPLRVGRTNGMKNRFKEPKKYVGLRPLEANEWD
jgi:cytochrome b involved in lipid metabolism